MPVINTGETVLYIWLQRTNQLPTCTYDEALQAFRNSSEVVHFL